MGYQCYEMNGRDQGYGVPAKCDHPGCDEDIDRGVGYACGGDPTENCGLFFCSKHKSHDRNTSATGDCEYRHDFGVCERCANDQEPFTASEDTRFWRAWKMNHPSWAEWRSENPDFVKRNAGLFGDPDVMREILEESTP